MVEQDLKQMIGRVIETKMEKVVYGGDGLTRTDDGAVLMVPYAIPGEVVKVEIKQAKKNHLRGEITDISGPSADRTSPECEYYGKCGGCQYQHIRYSTQCRIKHEQVTETLSRLGKVTDSRLAEILHDISPSPQQTRYRNRIVLHHGGHGKYGYFTDDNRTVIPISSCSIANDEINFQLANFSDLEIEMGQKRLMLLGFRPEWVNTTKNEVNISLLDKVFTLNAGCFLQANIAVFEDLLRYVFDECGVMQGKILVDLYCGIGITSVLSAERFTKVLGYDINSNNIGYARRNLERHGIDNTTFFTSDASEALQKLEKNEIKPNTIIVDPPREGIGPDVVKSIKALSPDSLVYISCDPSTFARDMRDLSEDYTLTSVKPFDMFPQTAHIEIVGIFKKK